MQLYVEQWITFINTDRQFQVLTGIYEQLQTGLPAVRQDL